MTYKKSSWLSGRPINECARVRIAELQASAIRQNEAAKEYHRLSEQADRLEDKILFGECASRAFNTAKSFERSADETEILSQQ